MNNSRSEKHSPWIRECGVHITKHLKNFQCILIMEGTKALHIHPNLSRKEEGYPPIH
jgi:hypothetical protein